MNVQHPDMLRQGVSNMHQNLINQPFFPQSQPGQQSSPHNMGPFQNNQGTNPGLGLMGGQPNAANAGYALNMQQAQPGRRPAGMFMGPHPGGPAPSSLNAPGGGPAHMSGLGPGQLQNMSAFPGGSMMGQQLRRVQSQPMNPNGAHMAGMQHGMQPGMQPGMIGGGMALNGPPSMGGTRAPMTAAQQQLQLQMRQQQAQLQAQGGAMSPDMGLPMSRPTHMPGAGPMPPHARTPSGQALMPTSMSQHGMQQPMPNNGYPNPMSLQHHQHQHQHQPHQQGQLGTSPHIAGQQQSNMAGVMGGSQLPPQAGVNRAQMPPDNSMFMSFQNQPIQPPSMRGIPHLPNSNSQFNFNASPTPPNLGGNPTMNTTGPTTQGLITPAQALDKMNAGVENFPAGSYGMGQPPMNAPPRPPSQHSPRNPFPVPQPQTAHPSQQSPRQADRLTGPMQPPAGLMPRPQSQPQVHHRQSPIPPAPSRTPRTAHAPLPMNTGGMMPPGRIPPGPGQSPQGPAHQQVQPPASAPPSTHPTQIAPRPPSANAATASANARVAPPPSTRPPSSQRGPTPDSNQAPQAGPSTLPPAPGPAPPPAPVPAPAPAAAPAPPAGARPPPIYPVGFGQAVCRLLQFSGHIAAENQNRFKQSHWDEVVATYFTEKAKMKLTLWKDNQQVEAKPFEIGYPILPRFFLVTSQSGVKTMTISIDGARERLINPQHALVECANASWTFRYQNGYNIILRGPLTADVVVQPSTIPGQPPASGVVTAYTLKLERLQFDAFYHDKFIAVEAIQGERIPESPRPIPPSPGAHPGPHEEARFEEARYSIEHALIPAEPINAFGIPQATMRCLELAESVAQMSELIQFSKDTDLGPVDALARFADKLRAAHATNRGMPMTGLGGPPIMYHGEGSSSFDGHGINGINGTPTMFTNNANANNAIAGPSQSSSSGSQSQNASQSDGPDGKAGKGTPQASQASGSTPAASASTPASAPTPGGSTTPSMAPASLKRKQPPSGRAGDDSPTTATAEQPPPPKKPARKRGRTQGS